MAPHRTLALVDDLGRSKAFWMLPDTSIDEVLRRFRPGWLPAEMSICAVVQGTVLRMESTLQETWQEFGDLHRSDNGDLVRGLRVAILSRYRTMAHPWRETDDWTGGSSTLGSMLARQRTTQCVVCGLVLDPRNRDNFLRCRRCASPVCVRCQEEHDLHCWTFPGPGQGNEIEIETPDGNADTPISVAIEMWDRATRAAHARTLERSIVLTEHRGSVGRTSRSANDLVDRDGEVQLVRDAQRRDALVPVEDRSCNLAGRWRGFRPVSVVDVETRRRMDVFFRSSIEAMRGLWDEASDGENDDVRRVRINGMRSDRSEGQDGVASMPPASSSFDPRETAVQVRRLSFAGWRRVGIEVFEDQAATEEPDRETTPWPCAKCYVRRAIGLLRECPGCGSEVCDTCTWICLGCMWTRSRDCPCACESDDDQGGIFVSGWNASEDEVDPDTAIGQIQQETPSETVAIQRAIEQVQAQGEIFVSGWHPETVIGQPQQETPRETYAVQWAMEQVQARGQRERMRGERYVTRGGQYQAGLSRNRIIAWARQAGAHDIVARYAWHGSSDVESGSDSEGESHPTSTDEGRSSHGSMPALRPGTPTSTSTGQLVFSPDGFDRGWLDDLPPWDGGADDAAEFLRHMDRYFFRSWDGRDPEWNDPHRLVLPLIWILGQEWGLSLREINRLMHIVHGNTAATTRQQMLAIDELRGAWTIAQGARVREGEGRCVSVKACPVGQRLPRDIPCIPPDGRQMHVLEVFSRPGEEDREIEWIATNWIEQGLHPKTIIVLCQSPEGVPRLKLVRKNSDTNQLFWMRFHGGEGDSELET